MINSRINGVEFHKGAHDKLLDSPTGTPVALVREPENQHDANAIQCVVDGVICGYIPHGQAERLAEDIDNDQKVAATLLEYSKLQIEVKDESTQHENISDVGAG